MSRSLCVDIGAGTMDVLWFDTEAVHHYKAVVVSPVRTIAERAAGLPGDLVVTNATSTWCCRTWRPNDDRLRRAARGAEDPQGASPADLPVKAKECLLYPAGLNIDDIVAAPSVRNG